MDRVHFPHDNNLAPGTWHMGADGQPALRCPKCKTAGRLENHSVDADGTVNASIACYPPCDHHVFGILNGWTFGVKPAGKPIENWK